MDVQTGYTSTDGSSESGGNRTFFVRSIDTLGMLGHYSTASGDRVINLGVPVLERSPLRNPTSNRLPWTDWRRSPTLATGKNRITFSFISLVVVVVIFRHSCYFYSSRPTPGTSGLAAEIRFNVRILFFTRVNETQPFPFCWDSATVNSRVFLCFVFVRSRPSQSCLQSFV